MSHIIEVDSISQVHTALGLPKPKHPLVSVFRSEDATNSPEYFGIKIVLNLFQVSLKKGGKGMVRYGRTSYDFQEGTMLFIAPGQILSYDSEEANLDSVEGWTLIFHPDLIRKSVLSDKISDYSFFNYDSNEALHISEVEQKIIEELLEKIVIEYNQNLDHHSHHLINLNIQMILDYCVRFYERQFITRSSLNSEIMAKFEKLLKRYYSESFAEELGVPSLKYFSEALNISTNYMSDLLKKETGKTAKEHIHLFIIEKAKNNLLNSSYSISEIAYSLGFEYPQHFSSLFKSKTGLSPSEFRKLN